MSLARSHRPNGGRFHIDGRPYYGRNSNTDTKVTAATANHNFNYDLYPHNAKFCPSKHDFSQNFPQNLLLDGLSYDPIQHYMVPSSKRRKLSSLSSEITARSYQQHTTHEDHAYESKPFNYSNYYNNTNLAREKSSAVVAETRNDDCKSYARTASKRDRSKFEDDEVVMSRDEIDRYSPSRKDGIDALHETHLRYSYCTFLQNLGVRLDLPQTTIGTAMVLCHRFFARRSHASHDRFLIATATIFLAAKSEETSRPLNDVLRVSCEILYRQDFTLLSYTFPIDWFEQYRERITEAEQLILTTLNFELNVQHPYESLTSTLQKIGFTQSVLVNLALHLVSEGVYRGLACSHL